MPIPSRPVPTRSRALREVITERGESLRRALRRALRRTDVTCPAWPSLAQPQPTLGSRALAFQTKKKNHQFESIHRLFYVTVITRKFRKMIQSVVSQRNAPPFGTGNRSTRGLNCFLVYHVLSLLRGGHSLPRTREAHIHLLPPHPHPPFPSPLPAQPSRASAKSKVIPVLWLHWS